MSEPWEDIAKRLAAHPRFEWREGMMATDHVGNVPDLTDAATTGILLLGMWLDARPKHEHADPVSLVRTTGGPWIVRSGFTFATHLASHPVPGAAIALALLEAWGAP